MKKIFCTVSIIVSIMSASLSHAASTTIYTNTGSSVNGVITNTMGNGDTFTAYHARNPVTGRGIAEFDLQSIYALNISANDIISVIFKTGAAGTSAYPDTSTMANINFYSMNDYENGFLDFFNSSVTSIQTGITSGTYLPGLSINVTSSFKADLTAGKTHSGYSIRLTDELIGNTALYRSVHFADEQWLEITYNAPEPEPSPVPEPLSIILLGLGILCRLLHRHK
ncbi:MAG: hypothetical protein AB1454_07070 [Candidatus Auribacterota bacterium]